MKHGFSVFVTGLGLLAARLPLGAHHSTLAVFDNSKVVTLKGVVTEITRSNPHGSLSLDVTDGAGNTVNWFVELPSAIGLARQRWKRDDLKQGDEVTVDVWISKRIDHRANARIVHLLDGRSISGATAWDCASAAQEGCAGPGLLAPAKQ